MSILRSAYPLGIEFGEHAVRVFQIVQKGKSFHAGYFKEQKLEDGIIHKGNIVQHKLLKESLEGVVKDRMSRFRFGSRGVVASLPDEQTFYKYVRIQTPERETLSQIIQKELSYHIPYSLSEVYYDWNIVHEDAFGIDVAMVAVPRFIVDNYTGVLESVGLKPVALEPEVSALTRSLRFRFSGTPVFLAVYQSNSHLVFFVASRGFVLFTYDFPLSPDTQFDMNAVIAKVLRYHGDHFQKTDAIREIFVASPLLEQHKIHENFDSIPVSPLNPLDEIKITSPKDQAVLARDFGISIGLALRGYEEYQ